MPPDVAAVFAGYPEALRARLIAARELIFEVAREIGVRAADRDAEMGRAGLSDGCDEGRQYGAVGAAEAVGHACGLFHLHDGLG